MPTFHFNTMNGEALLDKEGIQLPSIADARVHALRFFGDYISESAAEFADNKDWRLEMTDDNGLMLFSAVLWLWQAPAVVMPASLTDH